MKTSWAMSRSELCLHNEMVRRKRAELETTIASIREQKREERDRERALREQREADIKQVRRMLNGAPAKRAGILAAFERLVKDG